MAAGLVRPAVVLPSAEGKQTILGRKSAFPNLEEFRGVPYGRVPGRWQHSILRDSLPTDTFDATRNGPRCPQPSGPNNTLTYQAHLDFPSDVDEDEFECLNLFIIRPDHESRSRHAAEGLPVLVWIHGGGYGFGASTDPMWNPSRLVQHSMFVGKPIIAININYRLNVFGFAASLAIIEAQEGSSSSLRGCNFGLGDQRIALEWISKNIQHFGGDPSRITIGGQSAGGSSAHAQVLAARSGPSFRPLFRRACIHSGAVGTLGPISMATAGRDFQALYEYFTKEKSSMNGVDPLLLHKVPTQELLQRSTELGWWIFPLVNDGLTIRPAADGRWDVNLGRERSEGNGCLLSDDGKEIEDVNHSIDVLIGDTDTEASIWHDQISQITDLQQVRDLFESHLSASVANEGLKLYEIRPDDDVSSLRARVSQLLTDVEFGVPVDLARTELSSAATTAPTHKSATTLSYRVRFGNPWPGVHEAIAQHCVELLYLFNCFYKDMEEADAVALKAGQNGHLALVRRVQDFWIDFIVDDDIVSAGKNEAFVFGKDRMSRVEDVQSTASWRERRARFSWIVRNREQVVELAHAFAKVRF